MKFNTRPSALWLRIKALLKREGVDADAISVDRLMVVLRCSRGTAQRLKEGHTNLRQETMLQLAERFGVPIIELLEDPEVSATPLQQHHRSNGQNVTDRHDDGTKTLHHVIKQYDTGGAMGSGLVLHDQPGLIHSWSVSSEWLRLNVRHFTSPSNLCIVTGFGDSMRPVFNPGDPLLVDTGVKKVDFDGMYFFRVGEEGFIKRLQRVPGEGLRVISANKDNYEPWTVRSDMDFQVIGRVIKVWCGEEF